MSCRGVGRQTELSQASYFPLFPVSQHSKENEQIPQNVELYMLNPSKVLIFNQKWKTLLDLYIKTA